MNIIVLYNNTQQNNAVQDHVEAFGKYSEHRIYYFDPQYTFPDRKELTFFDAMIIHYSVYSWHDNYMPCSVVDLIHDYKGYKVLFRQDEYVMTKKAIEYVNSAYKVNLLVSTLPESEVEKIYPSGVLNVDGIVHQLPGYVDDRRLQRFLSKGSISSSRRIDVGYRGRKLPYSLGQYSQHKVTIAERFTAYLENHKPNYRYDIEVDEEARLYSRCWIDFLGNCRGVLGTEGGSTLFDPDGELRKLCDENSEKLNSYEDFEALATGTMGDLAQYTINNLKITPRCFEYMLSGNIMILIAGEYSGILQPGVHYISVDRDYGNLLEVLRKFGEEKYTSKLLSAVRKLLVEREDLRYSTMVRGLDRLLCVALRGHHIGSAPARSQLQGLRIRRAEIANWLFRYSRFLRWSCQAVVDMGSVAGRAFSFGVRAKRKLLSLLKRILSRLRKVSG